MRITRNYLQEIISEESRKAYKERMQKISRQKGPPLMNMPSVERPPGRRAPDDAEVTWDDVLAMLAGCLSKGNSALSELRSVLTHHSGDRKQKLRSAADKIRRGLAMIEEASIDLEDA